MSSPQLEKTTLQLNCAVLALSVALVVAMATIVALNVLSRYVLHISLTWSAELARYFMVWSAMLAAAVLVNRRQHLAVDLLERIIPGRLKRSLRLLVVFLNMIFFAVMFISGVVLVLRTSGQVSPSIEWLPMNVVYAVIPVAALLMWIGSGMVALREFEQEDGGR